MKTWESWWEIFIWSPLTYSTKVYIDFSGAKCLHDYHNLRLRIEYIFTYGGDVIILVCYEINNCRHFLWLYRDSGNPWGWSFMYMVKIGDPTLKVIGRSTLIQSFSSLMSFSKGEKLMSVRFAHVRIQQICS